MLKVLEEVLKMEKLADGLVVKSSGIWEAGKGQDVDIWLELDME